MSASRSGSETGDAILRAERAEVRVQELEETLIDLMAVAAVYFNTQRGDLDGMLMYARQVLALSPFPPTPEQENDA